ncbi:MAG TPA: hypothetical protein VGO60_18035 [Iamia sp.]|jgi:hypothetical protein|nr:hypothetical protein [Iamia sp.]
MTPDATATATAGVVGDLPSRFMLDMATYVAAAEDGFQGMDFYAAGRGGALGDVPSAVVAAAFVFFEPGLVEESWTRAGDVMPRQAAADRWAAACHRWAEAHVTTDEADLLRLADLLGRMTAAASPAGAPCFAAWRAQAEPDADRPAALALHRLLVLRELRGGLHGAAVITHGLSPHAALTIRSPGMLPVFGWDGPHPAADDAHTHSAWNEAELATDRAIAPAYEALDEAERVELRDLLESVRAGAS